MTLPVYFTGTVSVSNLGTVVTGTGCMWSGINAREGDFFTRADGVAVITEVTDATHLKITPWPGATVAGGAYAIQQNYVGRVVGVAAAEDVGVMLEKLHTDGLPFILGTGETVPDPSYGDEGQFAYDPATGTWWVKSGGVWVVTVPPPVGNAALQPIFTFEGDSLSAVTGAGYGTWTTKLVAKSAFFARGTVHNFATDGDTASAMVGEYASQAGAVPIILGQEAYFFLWAGVNDTAVDSAATIYANLKQIWAAARASGYKVIAFTLQPFVDNARNSVRETLNASILSDATLYDFVIRIDGLLPNPSDANVFLDTIHPNSYGMGLVADEVIRTVLGTSSVHASISESGISGGIQVNGNVDVSQEYGVAFITLVNNASRYVADNWVCLYNNAAAAVVAGQFGLTSGSLTLSGYSNSVIMQATTALSSLANNDVAVFSTIVEGYRAQSLGWGASRSQPLSYAFRFFASRTGTILLRVCNAAVNQFIYYEHAVVAGWNWITGTIVPPPDGSVWGATNSASIFFQVVVAGKSASVVQPTVWTATYSNQSTGSSNLLSANSDVCAITGLLLLPGIRVPSATRAPFLMRPFDQELHLCKRYWQKSLAYGTPAGIAVGAAGSSIFSQSSNASFGVSHELGVSMRAAPTVVLFDNAGNTGYISFYSTGWFNILPATASVVNEKSFYVTLSNSGTSFINFDWTAGARL